MISTCVRYHFFYDIHGQNPLNSKDSVIVAGILVWNFLSIWTFSYSTKWLMIVKGSTASRPDSFLNVRQNQNWVRGVITNPYDNESNDIVIVEK